MNSSPVAVVPAPTYGRTEQYRRGLALLALLGEEADLRPLAHRLMKELVDLFDCERGTLFLFDWDTMELRANYADGIIGPPLVVQLRMGIVGTAILRRQLANLTNAYAHPYFNPEIDSALTYKTDSLLVTPMQAADGRILGGLELLNKKAGRFTETDETLIIESAARLARWYESGRAYPAGIEAEIVALRNQVDCDRGTLFVLDTQTSRLIADYADGGDGRPLTLNLKLGIAGMAAVTGQSARLDDAWSDARFDRSVDHRTGYRTRTLLCVPLQNAFGECLGVLQLINKSAGPFDDEDIFLLKAIATPMAIAIDNLRLRREQDSQIDSLLHAMVASLETRPALAGHSPRTARRALAIGRQLNLPDADLDLLATASALHDYGMVGVDDEILRKQGPLNADELQHVRHHAVLTREILERVSPVRRYRRIALIAASHHEAWDGSGYPFGLHGHEIPFLSRIIAVADAFEAMCAERPYRIAFEPANAFALISADSGRRYDPVVVAALGAILANAANAANIANPTD